MTLKIPGNKAESGRFEKAGGNPGRPKGARHKTTLLAEKLMQDDAKAIVAAVLTAAKDGDMTAAKLVLERIAPARKDSPVAFELPKIERPADAVAASAAVLAAVASRRPHAERGRWRAAIARRTCKIVETTELEERLAAPRTEGRNMTAAIEKRLARLEREREAESPCVILSTLPGEEGAPERELTAEEWQARHCAGEECQ